jgi:uncharacterized phiE125 gp8 family phage protein
MMLVEETTVPESALPVLQFREHLRLGTGFSNDGLQDGVIEGFLRAAIAAIEARTGKILIEREFSWGLTAWRQADRQALPVAPVSAIVDVVMIDRQGGEVAWPSSAWQLVPDMQRPVLVSVGTGLAPIPQNGSVRIRFLAGFGLDWSDLPPDLAHAVLMLAGHYYEYRHDMGLGSGCMPFGVTALIERFRMVRLSGGAT